MSRSSLMGNRAVSLGAVRVGVQVVPGYSGTPSTGVLGTVAKYNPGDIYVEWSVNEKAGIEVAAVAVHTGARTTVVAKQVGLNMALGPLMSLAYVRVKGGTVVVMADDPGPTSSQIERDTRRSGQPLELSVLDPNSLEEACGMIKDAFEYSEKYYTPILFRLATRLRHGCASVELRERAKLPEYEDFVKDFDKWITFPRLSHANHGMIETRNLMIGEDFSGYKLSLLHREEGNTVKSVLIHGISYEFIMEALNGYKGARVPKVSTPNPMPERLPLEFVKGLDEVMAVEELDPVLEQEMLSLSGRRHLPLKVEGKLTGEAQPAGENSVESVRRVLEAYLGEFYIQYLKGLEDGAADPGAMQPGATQPEISLPVPPLPVRPPVLCAGCPHRAPFYAVKRVMEKSNEDLERGTKPIEGVYCGGIGHYTLDNAKPLDVANICLCMGVRTTMAQGLQRAEPDKRYFPFMRDSTSLAFGLTGIVNAVYSEASLTLCILNNSTTAMTDHQPHPGVSRTMTGSVVEKADITKVLEGVDVKSTATVDTLDLDACMEAVLKLSVVKGMKVIIFKPPCVVITKSSRKCRIAKSNCVDCRACVSEIDYPALVLEGDMVRIDGDPCIGCDLYSQTCSINATETVR